MRACLAEKGWKQAALARRLGVQPGTVSAWLAGKTAPSLKSIGDFAAVFSIDPSELLKDAPAVAAAPVGDAHEVISA